MRTTIWDETIILPGAHGAPYGNVIAQLLIDATQNI